MRRRVLVSNEGQKRGLACPGSFSSKLERTVVLKSSGKEDGSWCIVETKVSMQLEDQRHRKEVIILRIKTQ